jgi:hypothetical protein
MPLRHLPVRPQPGVVGGPMIAGLSLPDTNGQLASGDIHARVQAGMTAYGRLGERHGDHGIGGARS